MGHIFKVFMAAAFLLAFLLIGAFSGNHSGSGVPRPSSSGDGGFIIFVMVALVVVVTVAVVSHLNGKKRDYSVERLGSTMVKLETDIINFVRLPGDNADSLNQRFAQMISLAKEGEPLPPYFKNLITKRVLFAYFKKFGDLKPRTFDDCRLTREEGTTPMTQEEVREFNQFCQAQALRS